MNLPIYLAAHLYNLTSIHPINTIYCNLKKHEFSCNKTHTFGTNTKKICKFVTT